MVEWMIRPWMTHWNLVSFKNDLISFKITYFDLYSRRRLGKLAMLKAFVIFLMCLKVSDDDSEFKILLYFTAITV